MTEREAAEQGENKRQDSAAQRDLLLGEKLLENYCVTRLKETGVQKKRKQIAVGWLNCKKKRLNQSVIFCVLFSSWFSFTSFVTSCSTTSHQVCFCALHLSVRVRERNNVIIKKKKKRKEKL